MTLTYFEGSKEEFIAESEKYFAWLGALYVFSQKKSLPEKVDLHELRAEVEAATGYPFSLLALRKALIALSSLQLAEPVSDLPKEKYFELIRTNVEVLTSVFLSSNETSLSRLVRHPHDTFRAEVAAVRKNAAEEFDQGSERGYHWPPVSRWSDYIFEYLVALAGGSNKLKLTSRRFRSRINWPMWAVLVPATIGALTIAIMKGWL